MEVWCTQWNCCGLEELSYHRYRVGPGSPAVLTGHLTAMSLDIYRPERHAARALSMDTPRDVTLYPNRVRRSPGLPEVSVSLLRFITHLSVLSRVVCHAHPRKTSPKKGGEPGGHAHHAPSMHCAHSKPSPACLPTRYGALPYPKLQRPVSDPPVCTPLAQKLRRAESSRPRP